LINKSVIGLLKAHRFARQIDEVELPLEETLPLLQALTTLQLGAASLDLARLNAGFKNSGATSLDAFLRAELADVVGRCGADERTSTDVVLYGFGRIGRLLARILIEHSGGGHGLRLRAIVVRKGGEMDLTKRASLLRRDSVHGPFTGTITVDHERNIIQANGTAIQVIYSDSPSTIDYNAYGIHDALVVDNTGRWRDEEGLSQHLSSTGVSRVLLTAPGKGALKNIVHGINHDTILADDKIITAASCTTNAITPVLKVLNDKYGIVHGHVETVHSFTNDQNLTDNFHRGDRRGRSAALNMVLTETGAAKAVAKALPELAGKLTGNSIRVPTPNVSIAILNLTLENGTTKDEVNTYLRDVSLHSDLRKQIDFIDSPEVVSSDFVGSRRAGIVDGLATLSTDKNLVLYVWYDNEFGYSCQVVRVMEEMAGVHPRQFPSLNAAPAPAAALV
jgi:glyceraldehyde 3-phosphate dehydrogenase